MCSMKKNKCTTSATASSEEVEVEVGATRTLRWEALLDPEFMLYLIKKGQNQERNKMVLHEYLPDVSTELDTYPRTVPLPALRTNILPLTLNCRY